MEHLGNIRFYCDKHAPKPQEQFRDWDPKDFVGRHVKLAFPADDPENPHIEREHMWVKVMEVDGQRLIGKLDNDPLFVSWLEDGSEVSFGRQEVEDVL